jgi:hypothetical protein
MIFGQMIDRHGKTHKNRKEQVKEKKRQTQKLKKKSRYILQKKKLIKNHFFLISTTV